MKNNFQKEVGISTVLIVLAVFLLNPFHFWMPDMTHMLVLALTLVVFGLFAAFVYREKAEDEREVAHRMYAGRASFLFGSGILTIGIIVQSLQKSVDVWLVIALVVMLLSKLLSRMDSDRNR